MSASRLAVVTAGTLAAALALAATATATATGGGSAADTVRHLQDKGYSVQVNGTAGVPLSECLATGVYGVPNSAQDAAGPLWTTVYVDISCPSNN